ncbi:hypothetical protein DW921_12730 [Phocaeicola coprophilus]|uniref:Uncharacterized protein n=1 Tax=Phocaeicola coprophilus TaxID=387090 RepID=A0A413SWJ7_9BACT|nr:hypothetical protein DW921_12730 [Phocaeicola coprophilus]
MYFCIKSEAFSHTTPIFLPKEYQGKEVLPMKGKFIEYKVAEYPERTAQGLEWVVIFKRVYL